MRTDEIDELASAVEHICSEYIERRQDAETRSDADATTLDRELWQTLEDSGFTLVSISTDSGGSGGSMQEAAAILGAAAKMSVAAPLAETMWLAGWMLAGSGMKVPRGPMTAAVAEPAELTLTRTEGGWTVDGVLRRVPWATSSDLVVTLVAHDATEMVVALRPADGEVRHGENLAGEAREDVVYHKTPLDEAAVTPAGQGVSAKAFFARATLSRVVGMAGAAESVVSLAVKQAKEREQFGRPIGKFQAVQQLLAQLASESFALTTAAQAAVMAFETGTPERAAFAIAAAKASGSEAAGSIAAWGHQVLGALGFTMEHPLHHSTRRLWAWRDECGNERRHSLEAGRRAIATDAWDLIVGHDNV